MSACPVCGHKDGACQPKTRQIFSPMGEFRTNALPREPIQRTRIGVAGYQGTVELYDPRHPKIHFVQDDDLAISEEAPSDAASRPSSDSDGASSEGVNLAISDDAAPERSVLADGTPTASDAAPSVPVKRRRRKKADE